MLTVLSVTLADVTGRVLRATMLVAASLALLSSAGAAHAATAIIDWPTYLRTGPGRQFAVVQELARGAPVDVLACTDRWCSVRLDRGIGYVEQYNLGPFTPLAAPTTAAPGCFNSQRNGYENGETFRYCPR